MPSLTGTLITPFFKLKVTVVSAGYFPSVHVAASWYLEVKPSEKYFSSRVSILSLLFLSQMRQSSPVSSTGVGGGTGEFPELPPVGTGNRKGGKFGSSAVGEGTGLQRSPVPIT